ncbi:hypothetical protein HOY80DRAFT_540100 [Tuber brumale]|nr:hypothetical protein HOY80DRAFT_540100 [Tuber brumale]
MPLMILWMFASKLTMILCSRSHASSRKAIRLQSCSNLQTNASGSTIVLHPLLLPYQRARAALLWDSLLGSRGATRVVVQRLQEYSSKTLAGLLVLSGRGETRKIICAAGRFLLGALIVPCQ